MLKLMSKAAFAGLLLCQAGLAFSGEEEAVLTHIKTVPTNGGFNPAYAAIEVSGQVMLGSNSCFAAGASARLEQHKTSDGIEVVAILSKEDDPNRICPLNYAPVYQKVDTYINYQRSAVKDIVILHAEQMDHTASAFSYTQQP